MFVAAAGWLRADQVELQNGDHFVGHVLSLSGDTLVLQSDALGTVKVPRTKIISISFGSELPKRSASVARTNSLAGAPALTPPGTKTETSPEVAAALKKLNGGTNALQQVQSQILNDAGPEAKAKFNDLLSGYLSGKLSLDDIRAQAKTAADQVRSYRHELGDEAGGMLDTYLSILDKFVNETDDPKAQPKK